MRTPAIGLILALGLASTAALGPTARSAAASGDVSDRIDDPANRVRTTVLENGLTVLTLEDASTPVVSFQMWVRAGSRDESRTTGIAHLFEHMMFKGSKNIGPEEHARLIEGRGGRINAYTNRDVTVYFEDVAAESLPLVIDLEAERVANLDISDATLASEREVVIEERRMRTEDRPSGRLFEALLALTFRAHPYRWPVIGWRSDLEAVTVETCREFFDAYYAPNNLVLSIVGPFDTDATLEQIRRTFGPLPPAAQIPRNPTREPEQRGRRTDSVRFDVRGELFAAAWHAPATGHPDGPALDVLGQILTAGRSSRFYRRLVREGALALNAEGGYWEMHDAGLFYLSVAVRPDADRITAEAVFFEEIDRVREEPVGEAEVAKAKRQLEVALVNGLRTSHALASRFGQDWVAFQRIRPLDERLDAIRAVSVEDVQRVARTYLTSDGLNLVRVIAPGAADPTEAVAW